MRKHAVLMTLALLSLLALALVACEQPASPAPASQFVFFADAVGLGWEDWSWDCRRDFKSVSPIHEGKYAIAVDYEKSWGGLAFGRHDPINTQEYNRLEFWIHGGASGGQLLRVSFNTCPNDCERPPGGVSINDPKYIEEGTVSPNTWKLVSIPLADLDVVGVSVVKLNIIDNSSGGTQPTLFIDDVALVKETTVESIEATRTPTITPTPAPTSTPTSTSEEQQSPVAEESEFVTRQGSQLMLAGRPFRFVGTNAYFLQPEMAYGNAAGVVETLDTMVELGLSVARVWAFNDHDPEQDPAAIQVAPGVYREESLVALDRVVAEAKQRNIRLILTLVNYWPDYGGVNRYVAWCNCNASASDFYTDERMKGWYRDYVTMLVNRTNTVTGIPYRDEPTILALELGNELRNPGGRPEDLLAWQEEMAAYIKSLDPNHLVADGGEGFDDAPDLYPGLSNPYAVRGGEGASYHRLVDLPSIDLVSYHLYPSKWGLDDDGDVVIWIRVHEALAQQAGKVAYLGEYGVAEEDTLRAATFDRWLTTALADNRSTGSLVWGLVYESRPDYDGFSVYCPTQVETCAILRDFAADLSIGADR